MINVEQESQNIEVPQEESQSEIMESKEEGLPCSSYTGFTTGIHVCALWNIEPSLVVKELYNLEW